MANTAPKAVPNQYVVAFKSGTSRDRCETHCAWAHGLHSESVSAFSTAEEKDKYAGVTHHFRFPDGWAGYAGSFEESIASQIAESEEVEFIEPDYVVTTCKTIVDTNAKSWGIARVSQPNKPADAAAKKTYAYDSSAGENTYAYIIDTGILTDHEQFEGRATWGYNAVPGSADTDRMGHGTHVSGTIGSAGYGIAKKTNLVAVKVLGDNGQGSTSGVINGLQWAVQDAQQRGIINRSVANMSLGGGKSEVLNSAIASAVSHGMVVCVAAGNDAVNASTQSPASEITAITVGSTTKDDKWSYFSNFGQVVDILAPGTDITSCWIDESGGDSTSETKTISGTSMATPHITGLSLYLMSLEKIKTTGGVRNRLVQLAQKNKISGVPKDTPDGFAYNGIQKGGSQLQEQEQAAPECGKQQVEEEI